MPRKDIKIEDKNLEAEIVEYENQLQELKKKNDIPALTELLMKPTIMASKEGRSEKTSLMIESVKDFVRDLSKRVDKESKQIDPENLNILTQIWKYFCEKTNDLYIKAGHLFDDYEKRLKNREIKGAEPISGDDRRVKKVAQDLMLSEMNDELNAPYFFRNNFLEPIVSDNNPQISDDLKQKYYTDAKKDTIEKYFMGIESEVNQNYRTKNNIPEDKYREYKNIGQDRNTQEDKTGFYVKQNRKHDDPQMFTKIPDDIKLINKLKEEANGDNEKYEQSLNEYEDDIRHMLNGHTAYNVKIQAFVDKLKKLNSKFEDIVKDKKIPQTENFINYKNNIENLSKLGTDDYISCLRNGSYDKKKFQYFKDSTLSPMTIKLAMENFKDDLEFYSNEVYDVVQNHKNNEPQTREDYKNGITEEQFKTLSEIDDLMTDMIDIKDAMFEIGEANHETRIDAKKLKNTIDLINSERKLHGFYTSKPYEMEKTAFGAKDGMQAVFENVITDINNSLADKIIQSDEYDNYTKSLIHSKDIYEKLMMADKVNNPKMVAKYSEDLIFSLNQIKELSDQCKDFDEELVANDSSCKEQADMRAKLLDNFNDTVSAIKEFSQTMQERAKAEYEQQEKERAEQEKEKSEQIVKAREEEAQKAKEHRENINKIIRAKIDGYKKIKKDENSSDIQRIAANYAKNSLKGLLNTATANNGEFDKETLEENIVLNLAAITAQKIIEKGGEKLPKDEQEFIDFTKGLASNKQFRNSITDIKSSKDVIDLLGDEKGEAKILDNFLTNSKYEKDHPTTTVNTQAPAANKTLSNN